MNIFSKMKEGVKKEKPTAATVAKAQDAVRFVHEQSERRRLSRMAYELQWKLNANFLYGNQHCDVNVARMTVENYRPMYDYLSREVFNRIAPLLETRMANLQTVHYNMTVRPRTNEYDDILKASVSTALLRAKQEQSDFSEKLDLAIHWCELTGSAFFLSGWNRSDGQNSVNAPEKEKEDAGGDVEYTVLTPYEVFPDNLCCETVSGQQSILIEQVKSIVEIENLYGISPAAGTVTTLCCRPVSGAGGYGYTASTLQLSEGISYDSVVLYTYMERPSAAHAQGRLLLVAGDTLIFDGDLPYDDFPLCQMKCHTVPGQFYGRSVIENLIPLQRSYNGIKNKINDHINLTASGQMVIEEGSVDSDDLAGGGLAPGIPVVYGKGCEKPSLLPSPTLPSIVGEQCDRIAADMEYIAGVSQLMVSGIAPSGITSGTAIDSLRQIDSTRLAMTADNIRHAVSDLAVIWLKLYHDFGGVNRALWAKGENEEAEVLYWNAEQINSFEVIFDTENELKDSQSKRFDRFLTAIENGLYANEEGKIPRKVLRKARQSMGMDAFGVILEEDLQEQNARRENLMFEKGGELSVTALDDHTIHLEEHRLYALQKTFYDMVKRNPQKAERMYAHIAMHENALLDKEKGEE